MATADAPCEQFDNAGLGIAREAAGRIAANLDPAAGPRILTAAMSAARWHEGQARKNGDPYITHPLEVAELVASWGMDEASVLAALLHDVVEDTDATLDQVGDLFPGELGVDVRRLVDGLTKIDGIKLAGVAGKTEASAAALAKLLLAMASDARVLVVKLADRLHNVRTLDALPAAKAARIAKETMEVYAPLGQRLGLSKVSTELEDRCFMTLWPERYLELEKLVAEKAGEREAQTQQLCDELLRGLQAAGIDASVTGRSKHLWSIYEKMVSKGRSFDQIFDLVAARCVVKTVPECYAALGIVHNIQTPIPGRFKDWIATPKYNLYQSLHTTVIGPGGMPVEIQIRTEAMHHRSEWGVAAHWRYKDDPASSPAPPGSAAWMGRLQELGTAAANPASGLDAASFLEHLKSDLSGDEVFCFTPAGEAVVLPSASTPVDFAYAIHSDIGNTCTGAKVNGSLVQLSTVLRSGDRVEIVTGRRDGPGQDWLTFVASGRAKERIRQWRARERRDGSADAGRVALAAAVNELGLSGRLRHVDDLGNLAMELGYNNTETLLAAIGESKVSAEIVARRLSDVVSPQPVRHKQVSGGAERHGSVSVSVDGIDGMSTRLARCCSPIPGDQLVGYVASSDNGRVVSVHRSGCPQAAQAIAGGRPALEVAWNKSAALATITLIVEALDRTGLLADVTRAITDAGGDIKGASTVSGRDRVARQQFEVTVCDAEHLQGLVRAIQKVAGVYSAGRSAPT